VLWAALAAALVVICAIATLLLTTGQVSAHKQPEREIRAVGVSGKTPAGAGFRWVPKNAADSGRVPPGLPPDFIWPPPFAVPGLPIPGIFPAPKKTAGEIAAEAARSKLGAEYDFGATGPDAFDCSGLVVWSYEQAGVELPRTSYEQLTAGIPVALDDLRLGDLVSFYDGDHSALYAGDGQVIHASTSARGVVLSPIGEMPVTAARRF
jgi:cell wall-associated NlpC family hydrolase